MNARKVQWRTPLGPYISPYANRLGIVRYFAYARFAAALRCAGGKRPARVMDFGCWDGHFLPSLVEHFSEVWAVDDDSGSVIDQVPGCWTTLQLAQQLWKCELGGHPDTLIKATGSALPFSARSFDVVFCLDTLAHVVPEEKQLVLHELRRIINGEGRIVVSLPIETGQAGFARRVWRRLSGKHPCEYSYDFRQDVKLLETNFKIAATEFWPSRLLPLTLMLDCRI